MSSVYRPPIENQGVLYEPSEVLDEWYLQKRQSHHGDCSAPESEIWLS
jgi:hypothetical protein